MQHQQWISTNSSCATLVENHGQRSPSAASSAASFKKHVDVPRRVQEALDARGFNVSTEGLVTWQADSRSHPRNWSLLRKTYDSALICFLEFFMTLLSNCGSGVSDVARHDLGISRELAIFSFVTVYLLGQAVGGLFLPPIAESFGGRTIYVVTTFLYAVCCLVVAAAPSVPAVIVGRTIAGMLSAMPAVVACGSLENIWDSTARIFAIHAWIAGAVLGLALGPVYGTYISTSSAGWPWAFGIAAVVALLCTVLCFGMQESRPSQVLHQQTRQVAKQSRFDDLSADTAALPTFSEFVRTSLWQPVSLFFTEPIVSAVSIMAATVYGVIYLFSEALSSVYADGFGLGARPASLVFLALAVGIPLTFLPRFYDMRIAKAITRSGKLIEPEDKLFGFYVAAPVLAVGLWWFAATVPPLVPGVSAWASIASLVLIGYGVVEFDNVLSGYLTDAYSSYAASANAPMAFLRATLSGVFPLFGRQMFEAMGNNNALFMLAALATLFCGVAVWFAFYGKKLRERSPFASESSRISSSGSEQSIAAKRGEV